MKIAMVSEHASPLAALGGTDAGGQNVHVAALSAELVRLGHRVVVYTRRDDPSLDRRLVTDDGVVIEHVKAGPAEPLQKDDLWQYMPSFAEHLRETWIRDPPDIVHAHFWMSGVASVTAAESRGIPVALTYHALGAVKRRHQGAADTSPPIRGAMELRLAGEVDCIISTCADEVAELSRMGARWKALSIIPCGVDLEVFCPDGPAALRDDMPRVLSIGRLVERKGIIDVVRAMSYIPLAHLVVAGGPDPTRIDTDRDVHRLREAATIAGVTDRVEIVGRVEHERVAPLIRSADVVVTTPTYEPFGIVPLEAMACGVAVVVSAVGGLKESVIDGQTGLHVPPGDSHAIAGALGCLLADDGMRRRLGKAGNQRVRRQYGWQKIALDTLSVYQAMRSRERGSRDCSQRPRGVASCCLPAHAGISGYEK